ncbi:MAG: DNA cytosine methyltransferase [Clostridiaceae bacterium]|nr:DNA cytosine methyltransferase [Clostridiaceae bacterium]
MQQDITRIVADISIAECQFILDGQASCQDICFAKSVEISAFDKKVLDSIEKKYRKIYNGEILNHTTFKLSDLDLEMIRSVPQGGSWKDIPQETVQKSKRLVRITETGGRTTLYGRIDYTKPSYTITTYFNRPGNGTYVHPIRERVISVREATRFQCFPDDYYFYGNKTDMLKQVGNAVPVLLAYNIGKAIREKTGCSTSVDLFSGAGGMTYGFKRAGINAIIANDIMESACVTLKANCPEISVLCGDITSESTKQQIIQAGINGRADVICGGPPCQGFSMAGFRAKDDPRNQLFRDFVDIVSGVNPKVIVFENVEGLLSYQNGETYRNIIELFSELGYNAEGRSLFANHYGAPQRRKRVIILCVRKDIGIMPSDIFPQAITPNLDKQVNAYETIADLENVECSETAKYSSDYTSPMLQYLKSEISIDDFLEKVRDDSVSESEEGEAEEETFESESYEQLTIFTA